jgi:hypothetical protein
MPQVLFRQIKSNPIRWSVFYDEIAKTLDDTVKPELIEWFDKVTADWTHKPDFKATKSITPSEMTVNVYPIGTEAKIWKYVSGGTKPHLIPKSPLPYHLKFNWGGYGSYKARTTTSGGYKGPGKVIGGTIHRPKQVHHPGNKPRRFEYFIAKWYRPRYRQVMKNAVARGLRKAQAR